MPRRFAQHGGTKELERELLAIYEDIGLLAARANRTEGIVDGLTATTATKTPAAVERGEDFVNEFFMMGV